MRSNSNTPPEHQCVRCGKMFVRYQPPPAVPRYCSWKCFTERYKDSDKPDTGPRFWDRVQKTETCWLWTGRKDRKGYGAMTVRGKFTRVHRISYELHNGPIPEGLLVCHNCPGGDNPACINPAHLWLGTNDENMADRKAKGQNPVRSRQPCPKKPQWLPVAVIPITDDTAFLVIKRSD